MKLEKMFLAVAVISVICAVPVSQAVQDRSKLLQLERSKSQTIKEKLDTTEKKLKEQERTIDKQKKENEKLKSDLQAKRKRQQYIKSLSFSIGNAPADKVGYALAYYLDRGLTKTAASYLVGNLIQESRLDHTNKTGDGGKAWGLAQWHPNRRYDMPSDYHGQLEFVLHEMERQTPRAHKLLTNNPSRSEAALAMKLFEGYGIEGLRFHYAEQILQRI